MSKEIEEYNKIKLAESLAKALNGTYTQADALENFINGIIDLTVRNKEEREYAKMMISQAKEIAEKTNKNY